MGGGTISMGDFRRKWWLQEGSICPDPVGKQEECSDLMKSHFLNNQNRRQLPRTKNDVLGGHPILRGGKSTKKKSARFPSFWSHFCWSEPSPLETIERKKLGIQQIWENIFSYGGILNAFDAGKEGVNIFRKNVHVRLHIFIFENNHVKQKMKIVCGAHVALLLLRKWMPAVPGHPSMPGHRSNIEMLVITNQTANVGISFQFLNITWKRVMAGIP